MASGWFRGPVCHPGRVTTAFRFGLFGVCMLLLLGTARFGWLLWRMSRKVPTLRGTVVAWLVQVGLVAMAAAAALAGVWWLLWIPGVGSVSVGLVMAWLRRAQIRAAFAADRRCRGFDPNE